MKVRVDFSGVPGLYRVLNRTKEFAFEFSGQTVGELVESLVRRFGPPITKALLDAKGDIDLEVHVVLNDGSYLSGNPKEALLSEGDIVAFKGAG